MSTSYQFRGSLHGYLCNHCQENGSGLLVRLYKTSSDQRVTELAVANAKDTFHELSVADVEAKGKLLLAEARTDEGGNFSIDLSEKNGYRGEAFDIDFLVDDVPYHFPPKHREGLRFQFSVTTLQPQWRQAQDNQLTYAWEFAIPAKWWCPIRARFGAYVICGQVTDCETRTPLAGLKVSAFDVDLLQDDALGTATTNATGHFVLYYSEAAFSKTIFNWLNVEWPAGPDLYFKITTGSGQVLLQEPRSKGHEPGRENAANCFCIDFCVKRPDVPNTYVPALFTHVGIYAIAGGFDGQGFTNDAQKNAFTGSIPLVGIVPGGAASNAMEYRFKVKNLASSVEIIADANYLDGFQLGTLAKLRFSPFSYSNDPYMVNSAGATHNVVIGPQGWIRVPRENDLFGAVGQFNAGTLLGSLNTVALMETGFGIHEAYPTAPLFDLTNPAPVYVAGQPFGAAHKAGVHTFQITFEAREVGSSTVAYSTVLPRIVLTNVSYLQRVHPSWAGGDRAKIGVGMLEIAETTAQGVGCNEIGNALTATYSVVHPFLEDISISFEGNAPLPPTFSAPIATDEKIGSQAFNTSAMQPCAYVIHIVANLRLTSGGGRLPNAYVEDHIAFCKS
ncbi:hypothetical protein [Fibrella aquatilis]|uniref:Carboxypeptidase regulatory-like domain-containing protein n=1 Tax=Fibrella aquatilis TaxID=2817059 RepID=A0A939K0N0_9BACT|nr:hypothetical protein [Fibrella aquatilis]MBO0931390.1 hypothetical protein [Fibrella aquatilis]